MTNRAKRVLVAGLFHETNTFLTEITGPESFAERAGDALLQAAGDGSPMSGVLDVARESGWQVLPAIDLRATPSGTVADAVVDRFWEGFRSAAAGAGDAPLDGIFLVLHGAMVSESLPDVEGELLRRIRTLPACADVPLCGVLDLHANVSDAMTRHADAFLAYRENPHTDACEAARRAARLLDDVMRSGRRLRMLRAQPAVIWPPTGTATAADPMRALEQLARTAEQTEPGIVAVNVFAGFSFADVAEAGVCFTAVVAAGDSAADARARAVLARLESEALRRRAEGNVIGMPLAAAIDQIASRPPGSGGPVLLVEPSDNIGAGAPGDGTHILRALVEHRVADSAVILNDAEAVAALADAAVGETREMLLGGKSGGVGAAPLPLLVTVVSRSDGRFTLEDPHSHQASMGGMNVDMGPCAVVRHGGVTILLTTRKTPPFDLGQWRSQGIDPESFAVIGVKAAVAHRQAYDPIAAASVTVETPGPCASDLGTLPFRGVRRPVFPLDPIDPIDQSVSAPETLRSDYERDGVVRVRGLLTPEQVERTRAALGQYIREIVPGLPPGDVTFESDGVSVRNLWRMEQYDPYFRDLAHDPEILEIVGDLVKGTPVLAAVETFNKPARTGSGVPAHQDNAYFCQSPPDMLTVWIAIDAATVENGAIYYTRGSHAAMLPHRKSGVKGNSMGVANPSDPAVTDEFCGTLGAGDALIHHCQTVHRSDPNTTDNPRCGLLLVYRAAHTADDPALRAAYLAAQAGG
jgi:microcystin degradation protein MlrC